MIKLCGRCGTTFTFLDVVVYAPGRFAFHAAFCPWRKWGEDWRERLKASA